LTNVITVENYAYPTIRAEMNSIFFAIPITGGNREARNFRGIVKKMF